MATSNAILVSDTVKKDVVYSAECFDQSCQPLDANTQLLVEYSVMALEARLMAPGDWHDVSRKIDGTIDLIKGFSKIGAFAFPPAAPILLAIAGVGGFIQTLMKWIPDNRPDPVVEKYKELEEAIHKLEEQMIVHFEDMQSFITEHNFNINITTQSSTLMRFMRNCLQYQNELDVENFGDTYEEKPPLSLAYNMVSLLKNRSTNPLIMAMSKEKGKTKATFNKWKKIITGIMGEFLFIECFASGLLNKSDYNRDRIIEEWNGLTKSFQQWEDEYKKDQGYWEEMKEYLEPYILSHSHLKNKVKVLDLYHKLDKYLTRDSFYVILLNEAKWKKDYFYYCDNENDHIFGVWNKGGCNCFIYRSHTGNTASLEQFHYLLGKTTNRKLHWQGSLENTINKEFVEGRQLRGHGFIGLFLHHVDFIQSWPNGEGRNTHGPGVCQTMTLDENKGLCMAVLAMP